MRSLLLSRLSRLCLSKPPALGVVSYSSPVCHIVGAERCGETGDVGRLVIGNVNSHEYEVLEKTVPMDLMRERGTIGASHGWVATLKDGLVCLQDDLDPGASDSDPKRISLPPLVTLPHCQTQVVTNVAMSSSSPEDQDCIVAVKFLGPQLSLCTRPAQKDAEWVNIRVEDPGFFSSRVMYSEMDKMFSMPASGGTRTGSWDLEKHTQHDLHFPFYAEFVQSKWVEVAMYCRSEHLVDSPTGETFLVKWYTSASGYAQRELTKRFMVFRIYQDRRAALVTDDIGDFCIFLSSKGEPFCLRASKYGLSPNFVYYMGNYDIGKVNIRDNVIVGGILTSPAPYFIPP